MQRAGRGCTAVLATVALLAGVVAPAAAQSAEGGDVPVRDTLVVDVVNSYYSTSAHHRYDSVAGPAPVARASTVRGGVVLARPAGATTGPSVEVLPADDAPLAVGTVDGIRGKWSTGSPRPVPVVRLVPGTGFLACTEFRSTPESSSLVVHEVEHDPTGAVVRLSASWRIPCANSGAEATGELRYRSTDDYASAGSSSTVLSRVLSGGRAPVTASVRNTGSVPLELGAPVAVAHDSGARLELTAAGQDCSATPLPVGATCTLALEYVDDGVAGGGTLAELRLPAPALVRGHVAVQASAREVVTIPGPPTDLRATGGYDGVALDWEPTSPGPLPDGWRVRRVDGATPTQVATLPAHVTAWVDTSLAKGEPATYEVAGHNAAGEGDPVRVTGAREDRPDPPPAVERRTLVMDGLTGLGVADSWSGASLQVFDHDGTTAVSAPGMVLRLPRLSGAGTFPVGPEPGQLPVLAYAPAATCPSTTGTAEVREAWLQADGTVHRLDADLHLQCPDGRIEVALRLGTDGPFAAVTTDAQRVDVTGVVGAEPGAGAVAVRNVGTVPVDLAAATLTGADEAAFTVDSGTCGARLGPGAACALAVRFTPLRSGAHEARLALPLSTALGTRVVAVHGTAVGPPAVRVPEVSAVLGRTLVRWAAGDDGGSPVTGVEVQRAEPDGAFAPVADLPPDASSWVDEQVEPGRRSRYRLLTRSRYGSTEPAQAQVVEATGASEELLAAVATADDGPAQLVSLPVGGGRPVPLAAGQDVDLPALSPDGRSIAYAVLDEDGDSGLWLRPVDATGPARLLVDAPDVDETDPAWSPDGTRVCFSRLTTTTQAVWCSDTAAGTPPSPLLGGQDAVEPTWLPDGSGVVVTDLRQAATSLAVVSADGRRTAIAGTDDGSWPVASPTGDRVAFVVTDDDGVDHLRTVPLAGGAPTDLAQTDGWYDRPAWSPDGQRLAVPTLTLGGAPQVTVWTAASGPVPSRVDRVQAAAGDDVLAVAWRRADQAPPTVAFPGAPVRSGARVHLPVRVADDTVPVAGVAVTCRLDGHDLGRCAGGWTGTLPAGSHRLVVTATDLHGRTSTAAHAFTVDTAPPAVGLAALPAFTTTGQLTLGYTASDASGVASHDVRYRRAAWNATAFSAAVVPSGWSSTTARTRSLQLTPGYEYCLSVRARDRLGNVSAWSPERCTAAPLDDRALVRLTGGWASTASPTALAGTLTRTVTAGARLARPSAQVKRLAVVATTCPTCGTVEVLVGTTRVATLSLVSSTTRPRQVLALPVSPALRVGTVTVRSTRSGRPVLLDGLGLRRT